MRGCEISSVLKRNSKSDNRDESIQRDERELHFDSRSRSEADAGRRSSRRRKRWLSQEILRGVSKRKALNEELEPGNAEALRSSSKRLSPLPAQGVYDQTLTITAKRNRSPITSVRSTGQWGGGEQHRQLEL